MQKSPPASHAASHKRYLAGIFPVLTLMLAAGYAVYLSGGTEAAFTHLMYVPVILAAYYFKTAGAVCAALLGGLVLGPLMPKNIEAGLMQEPVSWLLRTAMFAVVGIVVSVLFQHSRNHRAAEIERLYRNAFTELPNMNKLIADLDELIAKHASFSLIGFRVINMDDINRYTDYETGVKSIKKAAAVLADRIDGPVYSVFTNEFAAILPDTGIKKAREAGTQVLNEICSPFSVDQYSIELLVKGGIVNYPLHAEDACGLIRKMGIALSQKENEIGLFIYGAALEQKNKKKSELVIALFSAIRNEEFYLVYQPIKAISDGGVASVEALLRWTRGVERQIGTGEIIEAAEEIGIINEITKWVIKNVTAQIKSWRDEGLTIKVALNVSSKDLRNHSVINYLMESIEANALDPSVIEIELTERSILENKETARQLFGSLEEKGITISLDDFGTGYNSLIDLVQIPIDHIKIDKAFIDNLSDDINTVLVRNIIGYAHNSGKTVIAEGVETGAQMETLREMGCDYVQGYYFSEPLPPEALRAFCLAEENFQTASDPL